MQEQILTLQEMAEPSADAQGQGEQGFTYVTSHISIFSDCATISIRTAA